MVRKKGWGAWRARVDEDGDWSSGPGDSLRGESARCSAAIVSHAAPAHDEHARGAGPDHSWHKGDRIPASYRDKRYEVADWKAHDLRQPPRGYHRVNVNGDYVLAAVATGVIADLLLNS